MAMQDRENGDWGWVTYSRMRVLRELSADRTEREAAEVLGMSYDGLRSIVETIKEQAGLESVREMRGWWRQNRGFWLEWVLEQAGMSEEGYGR
ncbi:MAG: hypothetical protein AB7J35_00235 [Dehalococcoidia bacterium]